MKARKEHQCYHCLEPIKKGVTYTRDVGVWCSDFFCCKQHVECSTFAQTVQSWDDGLGEGELREHAADVSARNDGEAGPDYMYRCYQMVLEAREKRKAAQA